MVGLKEYVCKNCNYRVKPKTDQMPTKCPYCEAEDSLLDSTPELGIKEVNDI